MYLAHYNLKRMPFSTNPDPRFLWLGENHKAVDFLIHFKRFLMTAYAERIKVFLLIDEAQNINHRLLEAIRLLSNIELDNRKLISIFFIGQTEFEAVLRAKNNKAIRQRITTAFHLKPLTESDTQSYIADRLKVAGSKKKRQLRYLPDLPCFLKSTAIPLNS